MSPILSRPFACVQHTSRACSYLCPQIFASTYLDSTNKPLSFIFNDFVVFLYYSVATMTSTGTPPPRNDHNR